MDLIIFKYKFFKKIYYEIVDKIASLLNLNKKYKSFKNTDKVIWLAETGARDFIPRLAQAISLWEKYSIPSIVIHKHFLKKLDKKLLKGSVVIDKSATYNCIRRLRYSKLNGALNIVIPEELLILDKLQSQLKGCLNPKTLNYVDFIACDPKQIESYIKKLNKEVEVIEINNPRLCTSLIEKNCNKYFKDNILIENYIKDDFLLINDNLGLKFSSLENEFEVLENEVFKQTGVNAKEYIKNYLIKEELSEKLLLELIYKLRQVKDFDNLKIVIRPHPTVDINKYINYFNNILDPSLNFLIIREGTAMEWMKKAKLIFHNNCTTAIEGYFCGMQNIFNFSYELKKGTSDNYKDILNPLGLDNSIERAKSFYINQLNGLNSKSLINKSSDNIQLFKFLGINMKDKKRADIDYIPKPFISNNFKLEKSPADRWIDAERKIDYICSKKDIFDNLNIFPIGKIGVQVGFDFQS